MITIRINGEPVPLPGEAPLAQILAERQVHGSFAVAVNTEFVPRAAYPTRVLRDGDEVEIVAPMQGG